MNEEKTAHFDEKTFVSYIENNEKPPDHVDGVSGEKSQQKLHQCKNCSLLFPSKKALKDHYSICSVHQCKHCHRIFLSSKAWEDHTMTCGVIPVANKRLKDHSSICSLHQCNHCRRIFLSLKALEDHKMNCGVIQDAKQEPLDEFSNEQNTETTFSCNTNDSGDYNVESYAKQEPIDEYFNEHKMETCFSFDDSIVEGEFVMPKQETDDAKINPSDSPFIDAFSFKPEIGGEFVTATKGRIIYKSTSELTEEEMGKLNEEGNISNAKESGPFPCDICGKEFATRSWMNRHREIHSDIKPHECHICNKTFRRKNHLKEHLARHNNERPHKCTECGRGFVKKRELERHMEIHIEENHINAQSVAGHLQLQLV